MIGGFDNENILSHKRMGMENLTNK